MTLLNKNLLYLNLNFHTFLYNLKCIDGENFRTASSLFIYISDNIKKDTVKNEPMKTIFDGLFIIFKKKARIIATKKNVDTPRLTDMNANEGTKTSTAIRYLGFL